MLPVIAIVAFVVYQCHAKALTAGLIDLALVTLTAFQWGFFEAAVASAAAVACLDFFYMPPIFSLYERDPQDWISSLVFAVVALRVSFFADKLRKQAVVVSREREQLEKLYQTSRDILVLERGQDVGAQLVKLIEEIFKVDAVAIWDARELKMNRTGRMTIFEDELRSVYFRELVENDVEARSFKRVLRLGVNPIGALAIIASAENSYFDSRSVDAIASLAAIALERAHSFVAESNAEAVRRSERLRSTILDGLAHAFKSPLATIHTASSGLLEIPRLGSTEKELASLISEEAGRLTRLTDNVLETAELDEGQIEVDDERIDLENFAQSCRDWFTHALADHPLHLSHEAAADHVWADVRLLQMALLQLIDNASKYARPASPITLGIRSTESEIVFSVRNEGSYVAPEESLRIFERFYRSPEAQHRASGNGIGLSVTKRIAEIHRGRVWVESNSEMSTTFFFTLPHVQKEV